MKILILCQTYPPEVGAAPSRISNMAEGLVSKGHEVEVICGLPNYPKGRIFEGYRNCFSRHENWNGVTVHRYWTYASNSSSAASRVAMMFSLATTVWAYAIRIAHIRKIDLVILQTPPLPLAAAGMTIFKKIYGKTTIINVSDIWPLTGIELGAIKPGSLPHKVMSWMERYIYKNADACQGQSREIMDEIESFGFSPRPSFLYRNLQHDSPVNIHKLDRKPFRIVYAGLLGVAQNLSGIAKNIDFKSIGAELHIYGSGKQAEEIKTLAETHTNGIFYHGSLPKEEMVRTLPTYNASIVPLVQRIHGAVPSKIFDLMPLGVPILFCGGGEGSDIIEKNNLGLVSAPGDYKTLEENIKRLIAMSDEEYEALRNNNLTVSGNEFSFDKQFERYNEFLSHLK